MALFLNNSYAVYEIMWHWKDDVFRDSTSRVGLWKPWKLGVSVQRTNKKYTGETIIDIQNIHCKRSYLCEILCLHIITLVKNSN